MALVAGIVTVAMAEIALLVLILRPCILCVGDRRSYLNGHQGRDTFRQDVFYAPSFTNRRFWAREAPYGLGNNAVTTLYESPPYGETDVLLRV